MPKDLLEEPLTPEGELLGQIINQPDYQQITIQEYSAETKYLSKKILNVTRHTHQSVSLDKRVDVVRQWEPIRRLFKIVGYRNTGSKMEIKTELFGG